MLRPASRRRDRRGAGTGPPEAVRHSRARPRCPSLAPPGTDGWRCARCRPAAVRRPPHAVPTSAVRRHRRSLPCWPAAGACPRARPPASAPARPRRRWRPGRYRLPAPERLRPAPRHPRAPAVAQSARRNAAPQGALERGSPMTATAGRKRAQGRRVRRRCDCAVSACTRKRSGWRQITSSALAPIEPVAPSSVIVRVTCAQTRTVPRPAAARASHRGDRRSRRGPAGGGCCP